MPQFLLPRALAQSSGLNRSAPATKPFSAPNKHAAAPTNQWSPAQVGSMPIYVQALQYPTASAFRASTPTLVPASPTFRSSVAQAVAFSLPAPSSTQDATAVANADSDYDTDKSESYSDRENVKPCEGDQYVRGPTAADLLLCHGLRGKQVRSIAVSDGKSRADQWYTFLSWVSKLRIAPLHKRTSMIYLLLM